MSHVPRYKKMIDTVLDRETRAGYKPLMMTFPKKLGCRVCSSRHEGPDFIVTVAGKRIEERKIYLWAIVTLCSKCKKKEAGPKSMVLRMMMHRYSEGVMG